MDLHNAIAECLRQNGYIFDENSNGSITCLNFKQKGSKADMYTFSIEFYSSHISIPFIFTFIPNRYENLEFLEKLECLELINELNSRKLFGKLYIKESRNLDLSAIDFRMDFLVKGDNIDYSPDEDFIQNIVYLIESFNKELKDYEPKFRKAQGLRF